MGHAGRPSLLKDIRKKLFAAGAASDPLHCPQQRNGFAAVLLP